VVSSDNESWVILARAIMIDRISKADFGHDPNLDFLNHGSFGACPTPVLDEQDRIRRRFERDPVAFVVREQEAAFDQARAAVAELVGARAEDLAFISNATTGVNAVLASIALEPDDEILITNHGYNACNNAAEFFARRAGARVVVAKVPFPLSDESEAFDAIMGSVTPRTRVALLDHITSPTALILPIDALTRTLRERGVLLLIDGAHGPGMVPLDLERLGADYYVGNLHKWCCAPKGAAVLHARPERQAALRPLVISHGANSTRSDRSRFLLEFDWIGTLDPSIVLGVPFALRYLETLDPGGLPGLMQRNRNLALAARRLLAEALDIELPCPESMLGAMAALPLPRARSLELRPGYPFAEPLYSRLVDRHRIQVPIMLFPAPPDRLVRICAHAYNGLGQYERLAQVLREELAHEERN
jgi:isopenicillin-N epimerase